MPGELFVGDLHLSDSAYADRPEMYGDAYHAWDQIQELAISLAVEDVILAGDVFDSKHPPAESMLALRLGVDRLVRHGASVSYIQGQHEGLPGVSLIEALSDSPTNLHQAEFRTSSDTILYGLNRLSAAQLEQELRDIPETADILVAHQLWTEFTRYGDLSLTKVPHVRMVISGDMHQSTMITKQLRGATNQKLIAVSLGATHMRKANEPGTHRVLHREKGQCRWITLASRHKLEVDGRSLASLDEALVTIENWLVTGKERRLDLPPNLQCPVIWLRLLYDQENWYSAVSQRFGNAASLFVSVTDPAAPASADAVASDTLVDESVSLDIDVSDYFMEIAATKLGEDHPDYPHLRELLQAAAKGRVTEAISKLREQFL